MANLIRRRRFRCRDRRKIRSRRWRPEPVVPRAALGLAPAASAGEKAIAEVEVPKPVIEGIAEKHPSARLTGFEIDDEAARPRTR
jgi:hypothetical protein